MCKQTHTSMGETTAMFITKDEITLSTKHLPNLQEAQNTANVSGTCLQMFVIFLLRKLLSKFSYSLRESGMFYTVSVIFDMLAPKT